MVETHDQGSARDEEMQSLVSSAQEGDRAAFERLYRSTVGRVYAICLRMVADPRLAETLTQDTFVLTWRKLHLYHGKGAFTSWLHRLTVNVVIENRRSQARWDALMTRQVEEERIGVEGNRAAGSPSRIRASLSGKVRPGMHEESIDLERAVAVLPERARQVFVLHDMEGYKHREIAAMTGTSPGTVKAQLHRARMLLRRSLSYHGKDRKQ